MNDGFEHMVWTRYTNRITNSQTSMALTKPLSDFLRTKFNSRTSWIQEQHDLLLADYRMKYGHPVDEDREQVRRKINKAIARRAFNLWGNDEDF